MWKMQYPLTDNSAIENPAVLKAFSTDIDNTESHVTIQLLCIVHWEKKQCNLGIHVSCKLCSDIRGVCIMI